MGNHQSNLSSRKASEVWSGRAAALVILCLLICGLSFFCDDAVIEWVKANDSKPLKEFAGFLSRWGDWPELMLYGVIGLGISSMTRTRQLFKLVVCMMVAATIAGAVVNSVRLVSGRAGLITGKQLRNGTGYGTGRSFYCSKVSITRSLPGTPVRHLRFLACRSLRTSGIGGLCWWPRELDGPGYISMCTTCPTWLWEPLSGSSRRLLFGDI